MICFIGVTAQSSLTRQQLWLVLVTLDISEDVVRKTGESEVRSGSDDTNGPNQSPVHGTFDKAEDVLYEASSPQSLAVPPLLLLGQQMVAMAFLADDRTHPTILDHVLPALVSGIKI